jgi:multidrug efflux pump subunit AcrA (membrane-fusion protein)
MTMDTPAATTTERTAPSPAASQPGPAPSVPRLVRPRARRRWPWIIGGLVLVLLIGGAWALAQPRAAPAPTPVAATATVRLTARGKVQPVQQARVGTLTGGVVVRLTAVPGERVVEQGEIARVRGPNGVVEVLTSPWAGTVTAVPVNYGDTVQPGATIATLGDLSSLQVETTDVDEYLIGKIDRGQTVELVVDALDGRVLTGVVQRVTLQPQPNSTNDEHYPVVIGLTEVPPNLRAGMSVRITFRQ